MKKSIILICSMLLVFSKVAFSETFFWEDKKGIHMTEDVSKLPPKFRKKYNEYIKQNPKQESKEVKITKGPEVVEKAIPESAKKAIKALKKLEARIQAGISYKDYSPALGDAKYEVNMFIESKEADDFKDIKSSVIKAMNLFDYANDLWNSKYSSGYERYYLNSSESNALFRIFPEANKYIKDGGIVTSYTFPNDLNDKTIYFDFTISYILKAASKELANCFAMINK